MANSHSFPRSTPEAEGISSAAISRFVDALAEPGRPLEAVHSLMLLRHGKVVAEGWWAPYSPDTNHMMFSVSKSYCSTAIGIAVGEGLLSVEDPVLSFFPDAAPEAPSANTREMVQQFLPEPLVVKGFNHMSTTT